MTSFFQIRLACAVAAAALVLQAASAGVLAQSAHQAKSGANGEGAAASAPAATAKALYEEAEVYVRRKFDEFAEKNIPFSRNLEALTYQEQRELALRHAGTLAARGPVRGLDLYYSGLLYALSGKPEAALDAMRRFLADPTGAPGEVRQKARAAFIKHAVELSLAAEAEKVLADYERDEPRAPAELHRINAALAAHYHKNKDFERAALRARGAFEVAVRLARGKSLGVRQRADTVYGAGAFLVDSLVKAKRRGDAVNVIQKMRRLALEIPSARLYGNATGLLLDNGEPLAEPPAATGLAEEAAATASPEIKVEHWIDRAPARLEDLRGRVVLLDFWATWCGPCRYTIPKLNALHKKYGDRGLTIIGLTRFYGNAEGRTLAPAEELQYIRQFKKQKQIAYGFGVADDEANDTGYGVTQMPTAVLLDRRGRLRFITTSASDIEAKAMAEMIEKLIQEP